MSRPAARRLAALATLTLSVSAAAPLAAHDLEAGATAVRVDLRVDDQRGLRVQVTFELPTDTDATAPHLEEIRALLAAGLALEVGGKAVPGRWRRGDDPKDGLSNGNHTRFDLELEPESNPAHGAERLDVVLRIRSLPGRTLLFDVDHRARSPWRVERAPVALVTDEAATRDGESAATQDRSHGHHHATRWSDDPSWRALRVVFVR